MKKKYETPKVEKMEFDYAESVVASGSWASEFYIDKTGVGCHDTATGRFFIGDGNPYTGTCTEI